MKKDTKTIGVLATIVRILLGITFVFAGATYFIFPMPPLDLATTSGQFTTGLLATGYFFPFLKAVETLVGLSLFWKRWNALSLIILAPIVINIFLVNTLLTPQIPVVIVISFVLVFFTGFLAWYNSEKYRALFQK